MRSIPLRLNISDTSKAPTAIWDCIKTYHFGSIELVGFEQTGAGTFLATFEVSQGIAWISEDDVPVQCAGTIDLECEFSESRADNTFDWDFTANEHLAPVEDEFLYTITNEAQELYSSAVYKESYFDPDTNGTCYEFEVNEQHKYCDISGVVTFQANVVREPGEIREKKLFLRISECEDSAVDVDWKILGDWTTEFVDHNYVGSYAEETEIWKLNFSISATSGAQVVLSDAFYSCALKRGLYNSMEEMGDTPNFYRYDLTSEYVPCSFHDGALHFSPEIETSVKISFDYAEADFSYLSKPYQELIRIGG